MNVQHSEYILKQLKKYNFIKEWIKGKYKEKPQDHSNASYFKRLTGNSELTLDEIKNKNSTYIYNKIRMLTDPYPNSYIKTKDNKKILIKSVKLEKK